MSMQLTIPPDMENLVQKRLASGAFASAEEVVRRALEVLDDEESWTEAERQALDRKIDHALEQVAAGKTHGPEEARQMLATMRETHLANQGR